MTFPRFYTLWAINAPLNERRLCEQLDAMRAFGFDGAVFHPRFYPGIPVYLGDEYMAILSRTVLYAKSIGMDFWIYDEDGWPSGTVGGQLLRVHPDDRQQWADLVTEPPDEQGTLGSFEHAGRRWHIARRFGPGVDYLNPALARHFLAMTHERYRTGLDPAAFEHVSTFFSDEPEFGLGHAYDAISVHGSIPWTPQLPQKYEQRYGSPLSDSLSGIFFPVDGHEQSRVRFWELLTDLFCEAFISPLDAWCRSHGKRLAAHVKGEEHPLFQVPTHGSAQQVFRHLSLPGIDALERDRSNDFFPRQLASSARQFGDGRSMVECFGGAGWGATPDDFRRYLLWLGGHGITDYVVHLWQYRLNSHAIRDWPASIPNHIGWAKAFPQLLALVKPEMQVAADRAGVDRADTLLVSPHRAVMAAFEPAELLAMNIHDAGNYADTLAGRINDRFMATVMDLSRSGTAYHIADERTFGDGTVEGDRLRIGHCAYQRVVLQQDSLLNAAGQALVDRLKSTGINATPFSFGPDSPTNAEVAEIASAAIPINWQDIQPVLNDLPLEPICMESEGTFRASFFCEAGVSDLSLAFADDVTDVTLNSRPLAVTATDEASIALIPAATTLIGENIVTFGSGCRIADVQAKPILWIRGWFSIRSGTPFVVGPNDTVRTDGPFVLGPPPTGVPLNLTVAGYPFIRSPVKANGIIDLIAATSTMQLTGIAADAARVELDGTDCGLLWGPHWLLSLPAPIRAGKHALAVTLFPSAYNAFGPHHHLDGDIHVVSSVQFQGRKNFADRPSAPPQTHVPAWHVKPLRLPSSIVSINAETDSRS